MGIIKLTISKLKVNQLLLVVLSSLIAGAISGFTGIWALLLIPIILLCLSFVGFIKGRFNLFHYTVSLIPIIIFSPQINLPSLPAIRLDDLWLVYGSIILLVKYANKKVSIRIQPYSKNISYTFIVFLAWIAFTIFLSSYREPYYYSNRDWLEIVKNAKLLILFAVSSALLIDKKQLGRLVNVLIFSLFISALFGFTQYFNFANVNSWLTPYFIFDTQVYGLETHGRVVGFFGNPNVFAGFLIVGIGLSFSLLLNSAKLIQIIPLTVFLIAMFFTQSRTGLIVAVLVAAWIAFQSFLKSRKKIRIIFISLIASMIPLISLSFAPDKFFDRISVLTDISNDNSFNTRIMNWQSIIDDRVKGNMLTGTGPVSELHYYFDNEWLQLLTNYGIIGIGLLLFLFLQIYLKIGSVGKEDKDLLWLTAAWQGITIAFAFYMLTLAVFQQLQLMPLIMVGLGLTISMHRKSKMILKNKRRRITW